MVKGLFALLLAVSCSAQTLEGTWLGTLGTGTTAVPLGFMIDKSASGSLTGGLFSFLRGTQNALDPITLSGNHVRIEAPRIHGIYEGTLQADGKQIEGIWTQPGVRQPLVLTWHEHASVRYPFDPQLDVFVPKPPTAVRMDGKSRLTYEVHITNWGDSEMTLTRLEILIDGDTAVIEGEGLKKLTIAGGIKLAPGTRGVVLVFVSGGSFPDSISHRLTVAEAGRSEPISIEVAKIPVAHDPVRISPPVLGGRWWAGGGPDSSMHHRGALQTISGRAAIPERFAFDFSKQVEDKDEFSKGDPLVNKNHVSYGAEAVAVADARVDSVKDSLPDNNPHDIFPAAPMTRETVFGNYVVLDLGGVRYATYAHLQPGSLRVKPGDKVRRGQTLGLIGCSGHCDAPHLHFQVTDGADPAGSEGVPFVFDSFTRDGVVYHDEMPPGDTTISFPKRVK